MLIRKVRMWIIAEVRLGTFLGAMKRLQDCQVDFLFNLSLSSYNDLHKICDNHTNQ